jgi:hypothetical protein
MDLLHVISRYLSLTSVIALTLTCKKINAFVNVNGDLFWKKSMVTVHQTLFLQLDVGLNDKKGLKSWQNICQKQARYVDPLIRGDKILRNFFIAPIKIGSMVPRK